MFIDNKISKHSRVTFMTYIRTSWKPGKMQQQKKFKRPLSQNEEPFWTEDFFD